MFCNEKSVKSVFLVKICFSQKSVFLVKNIVKLSSDWFKGRNEQSNTKLASG